MQLKINRKDYVTDNLVNIRDRLRENTAARGFQVDQEPAIPAELPENPPPVQTPVQTPKMPVQTSAPSFRQKRQEEGDRMRRDLELRLAHDLAELEVAIEQEEYSLKLKTDAHQRFAALQSRLAQCTEDALQTNFAPEIDRLRMEYFTIVGKLDALQENAEPEKNTGNVISAGMGLKEVLILVAGMTAAALIVGIFLLATFR